MAKEKRGLADGARSITTTDVLPNRPGSAAEEGENQRGERWKKRSRATLTIQICEVQGKKEGKTNDTPLVSVRKGPLFCFYIPVMRFALHGVFIRTQRRENKEGGGI